jgi:hypothetical protein
VLQIDESLFGRKCKDHRGDPLSGVKVWMLGMTECPSGRSLYFPVEDRSSTTLIPLIRRHVKEGSDVHTDCHLGYSTLNEEGYKHFTVCHKYLFAQEYEEIISGKVKSINTNRVEGSWTHAKAHFR